MELLTSIDWGAAIGTYGLAVVMTGALTYILVKFISRDKDEANKREEKMATIIADNAVALSKVADTIEQSNETNHALSETNRLLVEKMEDKLVSMDGKLDKILDGKN